MLDPTVKVLESEAMGRTSVDSIEEHTSSSSSSSNSNGGGISSSNEKKSCAICGTSKTPLWRSGPAGPKSLCNACGIRNRKKRRTLISNRSEDKMKTKKKNPKLGDSLKQRLMELGREVMMQRSTTAGNKLGEDEQAAVLLMALSYASSVYS